MKDYLKLTNLESSLYSSFAFRIVMFFIVAPVGPIIKGAKSLIRGHDKKPHAKPDAKNVHSTEREKSDSPTTLDK